MLQINAQAHFIILYNLLFMFRIASPSAKHKKCINCKEFVSLFICGGGVFRIDFYLYDDVYIYIIEMPAKHTGCSCRYMVYM